ncbi:MAG: carboxylesterase family protein [Bacteroidales bacterium]|jgi:para-nitrobenzyl esterase|nr:carboxylesterase family protein [Bacteroidales bacterium]MCI2134244.1 carboxylesterase family protein [Bacteroidales bacterium]
MSKNIFGIFVFALAAAVSSCSQGNPVLSISGGKILGVPSDSAGVLVYKGIPYAAPPVGDLRWKKPQPVPSWDTVMVADHYGHIAMQDALDPSSFYVKEFYQDGLPAMGEDCLYLNVWAPAKTVGKTDAGLPVAMWIHGGAFDHGWGNEITMDGDAWASRGVIMVTINYRVGIFGFFSHPELSAEGEGASGNYGIYDQIAALKWIKNNIVQFGGDPSNITILGQSAGGMSVRTLVASPASRDLMAHAIIQSGGGVTDGGIFPHQEQYDSIGIEFSEYAKASLGLRTPSSSIEPSEYARASSLKELRAVPADQLLQLGDRFLEYKNHRLRFSPHSAGDINTDFSKAVIDRAVADIPYMIGSTSGDMAGLAGQPIERFCNLRDSLSEKPVYCYVFERDLPGDAPEQNHGAFHSSELWYMFGTLKNAWRPFTKGDYELSARMVDSWTNFAKYGDPNGEKPSEESDHGLLPVPKYGEKPGKWLPYTKDGKFVEKFNCK